MRNHVSKVLIGDATANTTAAPVTLAGLLDGDVIAFDYDTRAEILSTTTNIGFAKGTAVLGEPVLAGPIPKSGITSAYTNPYEAAVKQVSTLTVTAVPDPGETAIFKVAYHDNLSILPNKIKQTIASVVGAAGDTTASIAAAIAAQFNMQEFKFVDISVNTNVVTFTSQIVKTASAYNHIDRPETVVFEVGAPTGTPEKGVYAVATTTAAKTGQGDPAKMAWMEEQAMGRRGYSDRTSWNDGRKYKSQVVAGQTYATLVITADINLEGDMQGLRANPIGVVIGGTNATLAPIAADLARAGIVPVAVPAS